MTQTEPAISPAECTLETIMAFLVPFFLTGAGGDPKIARAAIRKLIDAYNPGSAIEMDLAARIVALNVASMDNLRLSGAEGLSDAKVLRYRCNALTLIRSSDQARKTLAEMQAKPEQPDEIPCASVAPAPAPAPTAAPGPVAQAPAPAAAPAIQPQPAKASRQGAPKSPLEDVEAMTRDARILMQLFAKNGGTSSVSMPVIPDPAAAAAAAATAAIGNLRRA